MELVEANAGPREMIAAKDHQIATAERRIAELERRLGEDSSTSSRPPSSDSPYRKPVRSSSRTSSGRRPGKQPGTPGSAMPLVEDPDEIVTCDPGCCGNCGEDLSGAPVVDLARRHVVDPPPPRVTEYQILTKLCPTCGSRSAGMAPGCVPARVRYGPRVLARAAELVCAHDLPVARAARLMRSMLGVGVSTGFVATLRHRAAQLLEPTFLPRVRQLLRSAGVLHVDETPGRAAGGLEYVHVAATPFLTAMRTGGRSAADIDAGAILPGYAGTIVRDGYAGYTRLLDAHHAWCGTRLLRDLRAVHTADPEGQLWPAAMATTLTEANTTTAAVARTGEQTTPHPQALATIRNHYRGAVALGITTNSARAGPLAADALAPELLTWRAVLGRM